MTYEQAQTKADNEDFQQTQLESKSDMNTEYYITNGETYPDGYRKGYPVALGQRTRGGNSGKPYLILDTAERNARRLTNRIMKLHASIVARGVTPAWEPTTYYVAIWKEGRLIPVTNKVK